jgi:hypothetical protein
MVIRITVGLNRGIASHVLILFRFLQMNFLTSLWLAIPRFKPTVILMTILVLFFLFPLTLAYLILLNQRMIVRATGFIAIFAAMEEPNFQRLNLLTQSKNTLLCLVARAVRRLLRWERKPERKTRLEERLDNLERRLNEWRRERSGIFFWSKTPLQNSIQWDFLLI